MTNEAVLILGARSDIAMALAHRFANEGYDIQLAARNSDSLYEDKANIELRYRVEVTLHEFDALAIFSHEGFVDSLPQLPIIAVSAVGLMGEQLDNERDIQAAVNVMRSNFEGPACIFAILANRFEKRKSGTLVGISSVAGERGRGRNYVYGSSKAGFTTFLSGLRNRLANKGVHVISVLPGFVATKMTYGMNLPAKLIIDPKALAEIVHKGIVKKQNIIYVKPIWKLIMLIIRNIPEQIFKKMKI